MKSTLDTKNLAMIRGLKLKILSNREFMHLLIEDTTFRNLSHPIFEH